MSYNLLVWEGPDPLSNAHGFSDYERLRAAPPVGVPTPTISTLIDKLNSATETAATAAASSDDGGPATDPGIWAAPPADRAAGPLLEAAVSRGREAEAIRLVERLAAELGLVAFDPQAGTLIPSATTTARTTRFQLPPPVQFPVHLEAIIEEAINAETALAGVVEHVASTYYVQWIARDGTLLVEAQGDVGLPEPLRLDADQRVALTGLGLVEATPNWTVGWADGRTNIGRAAQLLARVMGEVRAVPDGDLMELQTFPT
ncbi:MAG: hypothetical protein AAF531_03855 [Actinomycetota bacterium]